MILRTGISLVTTVQLRQHMYTDCVESMLGNQSEEHRMKTGGWKDGWDEMMRDSWMDGWVNDNRLKLLSVWQPSIHLCSLEIRQGLCGVLGDSKHYRKQWADLLSCHCREDFDSSVDDDDDDDDDDGLIGHCDTGVKVKVVGYLYSASSEMLHFWSAQAWITQLLHCKYTMPAFYLVSLRHGIAITYHVYSSVRHNFCKWSR